MKCCSMGAMCSSVRAAAVQEVVRAPFQTAAPPTPTSPRKPPHPRVNHSYILASPSMYASRRHDIEFVAPTPAKGYRLPTQSRLHFPPRGHISVPSAMHAHAIAGAGTSSNRAQLKGGKGLPPRTPSHFQNWVSGIPPQQMIRRNNPEGLSHSHL